MSDDVWRTIAARYKEKDPTRYGLPRHRDMNHRYRWRIYTRYSCTVYIVYELLVIIKQFLDALRTSYVCAGRVGVTLRPRGPRRTPRSRTRTPPRRVRISASHVSTMC